MALIFSTSILILVYVYVGYMGLLRLLTVFKQRPTSREVLSFAEDEHPTVSVIIAAHNEEAVIGKRIENILASDYSKNKLEVIVASDGSTDGTVAQAELFDDERVRVFGFPRGGRAMTHNRAVEHAKGEILIFTDAGGSFEPSFIKEIVADFWNPSVGCVTGNLFFRKGGDAISRSFDFYWELEKKVFQLESDLGILAKASGTCMAVRRRLWRPLLSTHDVDSSTPLDVILQGYKVVFGRWAIAYDVPQSSVEGEFQSRIRITSKNFLGTFRRWGVRGWIQHPLISLGLFSHKFLRWMAPYFMAVAFVCNALLLGTGPLWQGLFGLQVVFYATAIVGGAGERAGVRIPVARNVFSFCIANLGMAVGVLKAVLGKAPTAY